MKEDTVDNDEEAGGWPVEIRPNGTISYDGIAIGRLDLDSDPSPDQATPLLTIDLGWLRAAGVRVRVLADPAVDRKRGGVILER